MMYNILESREMLILRNIKMPLEHNEDELKSKILKSLRIKESELCGYEIIKKAIDSRKKSDVHYLYNFNVTVKNEKRLLKLKNVAPAKSYEYEIKKVKRKVKHPVIVGSGPAGLLAAIVLAEAGLNPLVIEQGKDVQSRKKDIEKFWKTGELDPLSNVQFGAGGAGTFSDGKLTTGVNNERKHKLVEELISAGAPKDIKYLSKPHLGTDMLEIIVENMCQKIINLGGEIRFETKFIDYKVDENDKLCEIKTMHQGEINEIDTEYLILAIGHSARETFFKLFDNGMNMRAKSFAVGMRIEHLQEDVNKSQYGESAIKLDAASYKLNTRLDQRTLHTFCMCPGGVVVGAASAKNKVVTNGMSYYKRDLVNSNSAILVNVSPADFAGDENPLNGIKFQEKLEQMAFDAGGKNYFAPVQKVGDFLNNIETTKFTKVIPTYKPGVKMVNLNDHFPEFITSTIRDGLLDLQNRVAFLKDEEAVLTAIESRSSSPVTIERDEKLMCNFYGILPCGEGAGYAGGIVSAAIDGIRCAEQIIDEITT